MRKFLAAAALALAMTAPASAIPLTLTGPFPGNLVGPQSTSAPCIIAATQCQQPAGFGFNNFTSSGGISSYNMYSTTPTATVADGVQGTPYTVAQITGAVGTIFGIAIDVNTAQNGETLQLFEVIINNVVAYNYIGPALIGSVFNNGNGFGDFLLSTVNLSGFASTSTVLFHAVWNNASDGGESFFLVGPGPVCPDCTPNPTSGVPGPIAGAGIPGLVLACGGLIAFARRRRQRMV
jgi:hypothetical protein